MPECNGTILFSKFQIIPQKNNRNVSLEQPIMEAGFVVQKRFMIEIMIAMGIIIMRGPRMLASTV